SAAAPARPGSSTSARLTAASSIRATAGSSSASGSRRTPKRRRQRSATPAADAGKGRPMSDGLTELATANETAPDLAADRPEILQGLLAEQKRISPKYFYDERGSELFDQICELPEYYPTRTERSIMQAHLAEV